MSMNIFELATRNKLRFYFNHGTINIEDVWCLDEEQLSALHGNLSSELNKITMDSLLTKETRQTESLKLKMQIIKHIFDVKVGEREAKEQALLDEQRKEKILSIIEIKEDKKLQKMSLDELREMLK